MDQSSEAKEKELSAGETGESAPTVSTQDGGDPGREALQAAVGESPKREGSSRHQREFEVIRGEVLKVRFKKPEVDFVIFELKPPPGSAPTVVVGNGSDVSAGIEVVVTGEFVSHQKFGKQFKAKNIALVPPSSTAGITKYLSSGIIPGIGPTLAKRVAAHFGEETLKILERTPQRIEEVSGIGKQKAKAIVEYLSENSSLHEISRFLTEHHIAPGLAQRIYKRYGNRSIERLKENPYLLARDLVGVGFQTADSVAVRLGIELDSPERHRAGLLYTIERSRDDGHCYLPTNVLFTATENLLGTSPSLSEHETQLHLLKDEGLVIVEEDRVYPSTLATAEKWIAEFVNDRLVPRKHRLLDELTTEGTLRRVEKELKIQFSNEQRSAVDACLTYKLLVITGGPGCGKTTVTRAIVETLQDANCSIMLTAPTGRAAQRMSQVCNAPAKTIHRLLRFDPFSKKFYHGPDAPLEVDGKKVDVVIVDEASMIDLPLAHSLFSAIPKDATLILVGDKDQLPSVGPGRVFGELLSVAEVPTIKLSLLYRRDNASLINEV
ncbi:MAG: AAA family ATPase, partial [Bdellovibrionales bacterium]|nr:AAA family ATPase [Bdellovibrionales bacterium]